MIMVWRTLTVQLPIYAEPINVYYWEWANTHTNGWRRAATRSIAEFMGGFTSDGYRILLHWLQNIVKTWPSSSLFSKDLFKPVLFDISKDTNIKKRWFEKTF